MFGSRKSPRDDRHSSRAYEDQPSPLPSPSQSVVSPPPVPLHVAQIASRVWVCRSPYEFHTSPFKPLNNVEQLKGFLDGLGSYYVVWNLHKADDLGRLLMFRSSFREQILSYPMPVWFFTPPPLTELVSLCSSMLYWMQLEPKDHIAVLHFENATDGVLLALACLMLTLHPRATPAEVVQTIRETSLLLSDAANGHQLSDHRPSSRRSPDSRHASDRSEGSASGGEGGVRSSAAGSRRPEVIPCPPLRQWPSATRRYLTYFKHVLDKDPRPLRPPDDHDHDGRGPEGSPSHDAHQQQHHEDHPHRHVHAAVQAKPLMLKSIMLRNFPAPPEDLVVEVYHLRATGPVRSADSSTACSTPPSLITLKSPAMSPSPSSVKSVAPSQPPARRSSGGSSMFQGFTGFLGFGGGSSVSKATPTKKTRRGSADGQGRRRGSGERYDPYPPFPLAAKSPPRAHTSSPAPYAKYGRDAKKGRHRKDDTESEDEEHVPIGVREDEPTWDFEACPYIGEPDFRIMTSQTIPAPQGNKRAGPPSQVCAWNPQREDTALVFLDLTHAGGRDDESRQGGPREGEKRMQWEIRGDVVVTVRLRQPAAYLKRKRELKERLRRERDHEEGSSAPSLSPPRSSVRRSDSTPPAHMDVEGDKESSGGEESEGFRTEAEGPDSKRRKVTSTKDRGDRTSLDMPGGILAAYAFHTGFLHPGVHDMVEVKRPDMDIDIGIDQHLFGDTDKDGDPELAAALEPSMSLIFLHQHAAHKVSPGPADQTMQEEREGPEASVPTTPRDISRPITPRDTAGRPSGGRKEMSLSPSPRLPTVEVRRDDRASRKRVRRPVADAREFVGRHMLSADEGILKDLMEMGCRREDAEVALKICRNELVPALNFVALHFGPPDTVGSRSQVQRLFSSPPPAFIAPNGKPVGRLFGTAPGFLQQDVPLEYGSAPTHRSLAPSEEVTTQGLARRSHGALLEGSISRSDSPVSLSSRSATSGPPDHGGCGSGVMSDGGGSWSRHDTGSLEGPIFGPAHYHPRQRPSPIAPAPSRPALAGVRGPSHAHHHHHHQRAQRHQHQRPLPSERPGGVRLLPTGAFPEPVVGASNGFLGPIGEIGEGEGVFSITEGTGDAGVGDMHGSGPAMDWSEVEMAADDRGKERGERGVEVMEPVPELVPLNVDQQDAAAARPSGTEVPKKWMRPAPAAAAPAGPTPSSPTPTHSDGISFASVESTDTTVSATTGPTHPARPIVPVWRRQEGRQVEGTPQVPWPPRLPSLAIQPSGSMITFPDESMHDAASPSRQGSRAIAEMSEAFRSGVSATAKAPSYAVSFPQPPGDGNFSSAVVPGGGAGGSPSAGSGSPSGWHSLSFLARQLESRADSTWEHLRLSVSGEHPSIAGAVERFSDESASFLTSSSAPLTVSSGLAQQSAVHRLDTPTNMPLVHPFTPPAIVHVSPNILHAQHLLFGSPAALAGVVSSHADSMQGMAVTQMPPSSISGAMVEETSLAPPATSEGVGAAIAPPFTSIDSRLRSTSDEGVVREGRVAPLPSPLDGKAEEVLPSGFVKGVVNRIEKHLPPGAAGSAAGSPPIQAAKPEMAEMAIQAGPSGLDGVEEEPPADGVAEGTSRPPSRKASVSGATAGPVRPSAPSLPPPPRPRSEAAGTSTSTDVQTEGGEAESVDVAAKAVKPPVGKGVPPRPPPGKAPPSGAGPARPPVAKGTPPRPPPGKDGKAAPPKPPPSGKGPPLKGKGPPLVKGKGPPITKAKDASGKGGPAAKPPLGRKIHWKELGDAKLHGTIFSEFKEDKIVANPAVTSLLVDTKTIARVFMQQAKEGAKKPEAKEKKVEQKKAVLDSKRAQNVGIICARLTLPTSVVAEKLKWLDGDDLSSEELEKVEQILPTDEERPLLIAVKGEEAQLREIERHVLPFCFVPRVHPRVAVLRFALALPVVEMDVYKDLVTLRDASHQVRSSMSLRRVLQLVLLWGNWINYGSFQLHTRGFTLNSLLKLSDFKTAVDPSLSALHFIVYNMIARAPELAELPSEMPLVPVAARVSTEILQEGVDSVKKGVAILDEELKDENIKEYAVDDGDRGGGKADGDDKKEGKTVAEKEGKKEEPTQGSTEGEDKEGGRSKPAADETEGSIPAADVGKKDGQEGTSKDEPGVEDGNKTSSPPQEQPTDATAAKESAAEAKRGNGAASESKMEERRPAALTIPPLPSSKPTDTKQETTKDTKQEPSDGQAGPFIHLTLTRPLSTGNLRRLGKSAHSQSPSSRRSSKSSPLGLADVSPKELHSTLFLKDDVIDELKRGGNNKESTQEDKNEPAGPSSGPAEGERASSAASAASPSPSDMTAARREDKEKGSVAGSGGESSPLSGKRAQPAAKLRALRAQADELHQKMTESFGEVQKTVGELTRFLGEEPHPKHMEAIFGTLDTFLKAFTKITREIKATPKKFAPLLGDSPSPSEIAKRPAHATETAGASAPKRPPPTRRPPARPPSRPPGARPPARPPTVEPSPDDQVEVPTEVPVASPATMRPPSARPPAMPPARPPNARPPGRPPGRPPSAPPSQPPSQPEEQSSSSPSESVAAPTPSSDNQSPLPKRPTVARPPGARPPGRPPGAARPPSAAPSAPPVQRDVSIPSSEGEGSGTARQLSSSSVGGGSAKTSPRGSDPFIIE
ncbi:unnamed protein product [Vitrella brassicaformis CCMP3155]|uniref:FH2 domain-containing protein n=4 Tax=Vitrella brassicaformis TaxID=1169539 RepID=A0A0G4EWN0_VITBC|nr:unnamed protein product [Vitrella brassicaformis CCMP3155]|eukprot:CEM02766.1 unnamed protein product [Vitrella brassicaformis CCMP3155]